MLDQIRGNLVDNLKRVENLVRTYENHPDAKGKGRKKAQLLDILRAAVVLLHASLEEVLRGVASWKLPQASKTVLDRIPLVGHGATPSKFQLGELANHRGQKIDDILTASVNAYLERSNYNNTNDISSLLEGIEVDISKVNSQFTQLRALMDRRHQIVHRADRQLVTKGSGDHKVRGINKNTVLEWADVVDAFAKALFKELA